MAKEIIDPYLPDGLSLERRRKLLDGTPIHLDWERTVYVEFMIGRSASEASSSRFRGDSIQLASRIMRSLDGVDSLNGWGFSIENIEAILEVLYKEVQNSQCIREAIDWFDGFVKRMEHARDTLEKLIVEPKIT